MLFCYVNKLIPDNNKFRFSYFSRILSGKLNKNNFYYQLTRNAARKKIIFEKIYLILVLNFYYRIMK